MPAATYGAAAARSGQPRPAIEPASQATTVLAYSVDCARTTASVTIAAKSVESETPASISRLESMPSPRRANAATSNAAAKPATKPIAGDAAAETPATMRDGNRRRSRGADAREVRIDERIAQHALQERAAERKRCAHRCGDADAGQSKLPNDRVQRSRRAGMKQREGDGAGLERGCSDEKAERRRYERQEHQRGGFHRVRSSRLKERPGIGYPA